MKTQYKPYRVVPVETHDNYVFDLCSKKCEEIKILGVANYLPEYEKVLDYLLHDGRFEITFLRDMMGEIPEDKIRVVLRHDIDHDILTAVAMGDMENKKDILASYYIHNASPYYYGEFYNDLFLRYNAFDVLYKRLQDNGAEVGLHLDTYFFYKNGFDGIAVIKTELAWLRSLGLEITGCTSHGSEPYCGTENFEIFKEWKTSGRTLTIINGNRVELGKLSAKDFGLSYEGNYSTSPIETDLERIIEYQKLDGCHSTKKFLYHHLHNNPCNVWGQDITVWLHGNDCWTVASTKKEGIFKFSITFKEVIETLRHIDIELNRRIVFHIHPIYYGQTAVN